MPKGNRTPDRSNEHKSRPARVPMGSGHKLKVPDSYKREGYQQYWAITGPDHAGKLEQMQAAWWEIALGDEGVKLEQQAGKGNTHILMEIPQKYYDEDMAAQQKKNMDTTQTNVQALGDSEYVPRGQDKVVERELI